MPKIIEINKCMSCPYIESFLGGDLHGNYCRKMQKKKIEKISVLDTIPDWCPLEDKK